MKKLWLAGIALLMSSPSFGQSLEELKRRLNDKEAEVEALRERIQLLERDLTPRRAEQAKTGEATAQADEEDINRALERALVRQGGLLLSPGTFEIEPNFVYSHIGSTNFQRDAFGPGLALRVGVPWRSQLELALPYVLEYRRSGGVSTHSSGYGDPAFSVSHQFLNERPFVPGLIGAITYQPSTGRNTIFESAPPIALGSGFNFLQASITAVKRVDPLVFFGSYSFGHNRPEQKNGIEVDPGNTNTLRFGTLLATSPATSLRAAFNVTFFHETKVGGITLSGTDEPSGLLEFGGAVLLGESSALDVSVGTGVTRSAPDFRISIALPIRF